MFLSFYLLDGAQWEVSNMKMKSWFNFHVNRRTLLEGIIHSFGALLMCGDNAYLVEYKVIYVLRK